MAIEIWLDAAAQTAKDHVTDRIEVLACDNDCMLRVMRLPEFVEFHLSDDTATKLEIRLTRTNGVSGATLMAETSVWIEDCADYPDLASAIRDIWRSLPDTLADPAVARGLY